MASGEIGLFVQILFYLFKYLHLSHYLSLSIHALSGDARGAQGLLNQHMPSEVLDHCIADTSCPLSLPDIIAS
jgi:hypothetical protein